VTRNHRKISVQNARMAKGFSLFEMIVYLLLASIIFAASMKRFEQYPADAERANFQSIVGQIKAGVMLQMMNGIAGGKFDELTNLEKSNPMDLMLETPSNYIGAFPLVDEAGMPTRTWYFDSYNGHLVYLASQGVQIYSLEGDGTATINVVRFRIVNKYSGEEELEEEGLGIDAGQVAGLSVTADEEASSKGRQWEGLILEPVTPFEWSSEGIALSGVEVPP
jgi:type II secretory pathway pseudopilin PulG